MTTQQVRVTSILKTFPANLLTPVFEPFIIIVVTDMAALTVLVKGDKNEKATICFFMHLFFV